MEKSKKKSVIQRVLVVLLSIAVIAGFLLFDEDVQHIGDMLSTMSPWWLAGAAACILLYYLGETAMYLIACKYMHTPERFFDGIITTMIGFFYNALTPLASGGQPFQILQMHGRGINVGTAVSVMMVKFLGWHIALTTIGLTGFTLLGSELVTITPAMLVMFCIGLVAHLGCATVGILLMYRPALVHHAGCGVIGWIGRTFLKRRPERAERMAAGWDKFVGDYGTAMAYVRAHPLGMLFIVLAAFIEVVAYLSVAYFVYRGLGFSQAPYVTMALTQAVLTISVAYIPLPGASGASEGAFYVLFTQFFGGSRLAGMLIWRALTYYSTILLGLVAVLIDGFRAKRRGGNNDVSG